MLIGVPSGLVIWICTLLAASAPSSMLRRPVVRSRRGLAGSKRSLAVTLSVHSLLPPMRIANPRSPAVAPAVARAPALMLPRVTFFLAAPVPAGLPSTLQVVAMIRPVISMTPSFACAASGMAPVDEASRIARALFLDVSASFGGGKGRSRQRGCRHAEPVCACGEPAYDT